MTTVTEIPLHMEGELGTVLADIGVSNHRDEIKAEEGDLSPSGVRRLTIEDVLIDTGAMTLCLPVDMIEALGLPLKRRVVATTAAGDIETGVYMDAHLRVADRSAVVECLALPTGARPLLGVIPMEMMGLEADVRHRVLRVLPDDTSETYILAY